MAGSIGIGTMFIIIFLIIFALFLFLYILEIPHMKLIFWIYTLCLILLLIILPNIPYIKKGKTEETNPHFWKLCFFGLFIFIGFGVSVGFYIKAVLLHQDFALVLPKISL